jgi:hypothetical protein
MNEGMIKRVNVVDRTLSDQVECGCRNTDVSPFG